MLQLLQFSFDVQCLILASWWQFEKLTTDFQPRITKRLSSVVRSLTLGMNPFSVYKYLLGWKWMCVIVYTFIWIFDVIHELKLYTNFSSSLIGVINELQLPCIGLVYCTWRTQKCRVAEIYAKTLNIRSAQRVSTMQFCTLNSKE